MFNLYLRCETFGYPPSDAIGLSISDSWWRYQFDNAVFVFGRLVSNRYEERDKKGNRIHTLREAMGYPRESELTILRRKVAEAQKRGHKMRQEYGLVE